MSNALSADLRARYPGAEAVEFGDSRALSDRLIGLIRDGVKRATCCALAAYREDGDPLPVVGRRDVVLDWDSRPSLVIETTEVTLRRFCDVDADFALAEGENDSLAGWRRGHRSFFERNGRFHPEMMLVCERFRLIEDLKG